ncbi:MAG: Lrp/AsnC family transcriptional regulator [Kiritimatiellae bacterium]|jgi:DNA-binding Lrp family transcriptional regulator|nr:Lrp/AsnC family transcriptional regulator [Kiritimatiellia bacterium]
MDALLELLNKNARESTDNLAKQLGTSAEDVENRINDFQNEGIIRAFKAIINEDKLNTNDVHAVIELRIQPQHDGGFDGIAKRISTFEEVESLFLMSGGYDLLLFIKGKTLQEVAGFVSARLANIEGVLSTATYFMLKTYKDQGVLMESDNNDERLQVCP